MSIDEKTGQTTAFYNLRAVGAFSVTKRWHLSLRCLPPAGVLSPMKDAKAIWGLLWSSCMNILLVAAPLGVAAHMLAWPATLRFGLVRSVFAARLGAKTHWRQCLHVQDRLQHERGCRALDACQQTTPHKLLTEVAGAAWRLRVGRWFCGCC